MPFRAAAFVVALFLGAVGATVWLFAGRFSAPTALQGAIGFAALLMLLLAVAVTTSGKKPPPPPVDDPDIDALPGVVGGVAVAISARGISVPYDDEWRDFPGYLDFMADPGFPSAGRELDLKDPPGATFGVIGARGAVFLPDGSLIVEAEGEATVYEDLGALFADPRTIELAPAPGGARVLDLFGHSYVVDRSGRLVPAEDGSGEIRDSLSGVLGRPDHAELAQRYESRTRPGRVFAVIGGRPVRVGADGTVEWIRADGVRRYPSLHAAMQAIGRP